jgi:hypothetical protein
MAYSTLLGLLLPDTGSLSGTWGTAVNDQITALIDSAIAGTTTIFDDADVTLTTTQGLPNQARQLIIRCAGARTGVRDITVPTTSKSYVVVNQTTSSIRIKTASSVSPLVVAGGDVVLAVLPSGDFDFVALSQATLTDKIISNATFTDGYTEESVTANSSTAYTILLSNGTVQFITMTGNCTFTFPTPTAGKSFSLFLKQDGTGSRLATWPGTVLWPYGVIPTLTTTINKTDRFVFTADGTNWFGSVAGQSY